MSVACWPMCNLDPDCTQRLYFLNGKVSVKHEWVGCARGWGLFSLAGRAPSAYSVLAHAFRKHWENREAVQSIILDPRPASKFSYCYIPNRKRFLCGNKSEIWENEKCCGNTSCRRVFPQQFRVLPNFHECYHNSMETQGKRFLLFLWNKSTNQFSMFP